MSLDEKDDNGELRPKEGSRKEMGSIRAGAMAIVGFVEDGTGDAYGGEWRSLNELSLDRAFGVQGKGGRGCVS